MHQASSGVWGVFTMYCGGCMYRGGPRPCCSEAICLLFSIHDVHIMFVQLYVCMFMFCVALCSLQRWCRLLLIHSGQPVRWCSAAAMPAPPCLYTCLYSMCAAQQLPSISAAPTAAEARSVLLLHSCQPCCLRILLFDNQSYVPAGHHPLLQQLAPVSPVTQ